MDKEFLKILIHDDVTNFIKKYQNELHSFPVKDLFLQTIKYGAIEIYKDIVAIEEKVDISNAEIFKCVLQGLNDGSLTVFKAVAFINLLYPDKILFDLNQQSFTPLELITIYGNIDIFDLVLQKSPNLTVDSFYDGIFRYDQYNTNIYSFLFNRRYLQSPNRILRYYGTSIIERDLQIELIHHPFIKLLRNCPFLNIFVISSFITNLIMIIILLVSVLPKSMNKLSNYILENNQSKIEYRNNGYLICEKVSSNLSVMDYFALLFSVGFSTYLSFLYIFDIYRNFKFRHHFKRRKPKNSIWFHERIQLNIIMIIRCILITIFGVFCARLHILDLVSNLRAYVIFIDFILYLMVLMMIFHIKYYFIFIRSSCKFVMQYFSCVNTVLALGWLYSYILFGIIVGIYYQFPSFKYSVSNLSLDKLIHTAFLFITNASSLSEDIIARLWLGQFVWSLFFVFFCNLLIGKMSWQLNMYDVFNQDYVDLFQIHAMEVYRFNFYYFPKFIKKYIFIIDQYIGNRDTYVESVRKRKLFE